MKKQSDYPLKFGHRTDGDYWIDMQPRNPDCNNGCPPHWHINFEVAYQLSGERIYDYSGELFTLHAGDVLIIPPRTDHGTVAGNTKYRSYVFGYTPDLIYSHDISFINMKYLLAFSDEHSFERCRFSGDSDEMRELRSEIVRLAGYNNAPMNELLARASILRIHDMIYRLYTERNGSSASEFAAAVQSCIEEHISEDISPYAIADLLQISHSSLCHRLKAELGCTPNELIMRCKLNYAEHLLLERREMSVTEVGFEVGIQDTSYFIKCFKKSRGVTPRELRKSMDSNT